MSQHQLRIAFLWHQHQPDYRLNSHSILPWVRLHALKDYHDVAVGTLERFPNIRQTINVVPSLLMQLEEYTRYNGSDPILGLSRINTADLTYEDKRHILAAFFLCNPSRMIDPYPRYRELFERIGRNPGDANAVVAAVGSFTEQDWRDVQVWYNLTWIGEYSREREPFASLLSKGSRFTEDEKRALLDEAESILNDVIPSYKRLMESGQIELSVTPTYHPILPLLCNSDSAREALPDLTLPSPAIRFPEDARWHIESAIEYYRDHFDTTPNGMWPSEGSVSTEALALISNAGFRWAATDEGILRNTLGEHWNETDKYFPYSLNTQSGSLRLIFRDNRLSDDIGFVHSSQDPEFAARTFYNNLLGVRTRIINECGEDALDNALLPVILDGENCWEYYLHNGRPFLEALYTLLSDSDELLTTTISDALAEIPEDETRSLERVHAGSWIGSNFAIWIGHHEDVTAWELIAEARQDLMNAKDMLSDEAFAEGMQHIYIAEGSDWFWWYGTEHSSPNDADFDALFRWHLLSVYNIISSQPPEALLTPIKLLSRGEGSNVNSTGVMDMANGPHPGPLPEGEGG